ncbi:hypothetical protein AGMMS49942_04320 [Spirochaetia bacterium]|nr:hypothetical protein AGMMS49942_04320 [Spirochaetia bacterium]
MRIYRIKPLLKPVIIAISVSLVSAVLLFFLGKSSGIRVSGAGYAVLTLDDSWPDAAIRERLAGKGLVNTIGESSQWVFLDDFGALERVPLDSYWDRVEPFDLRNDGYAERLRSFFVFQGSRRLFIPLKGAGDLEGRVTAALGDIPFSLSILTPPLGKRSIILPAILFTLAASLTLYFSGALLLTAFFLPLWAVLAGFGIPGFALMAVLAGLSLFLREPVRDYFIRPSRRPLGSWMGALPLFLLAIGGITVLGALPPLTVILGLLFFLVLLPLSLWAESYRETRRGHIRFRPVPITGITRSKAGWYSPYARIMAPFTLASLVLLLVSTAASVFFPGAGSAQTPDAKAFAEAYSAHAEFQRAFSFLPLGAPETPHAYRRYSLAKDGLIDSAVPADSGEVDSFEIPPFPLNGLIDYLTNYSYTDPGYGSSVSGRLETGGLLCLLIVLGLGSSLIFRDWRGPLKLAMYMDKRIAA